MLITIKLSLLNFAESLETPTSFHTENEWLGCQCDWSLFSRSAMSDWPLFWNTNIMYMHIHHLDVISHKARTDFRLKADGKWPEYLFALDWYVFSHTSQKLNFPNTVDGLLNSVQSSVKINLLSHWAVPMGRCSIIISCVKAILENDFKHKLQKKPFLCVETITR